MSHINSTGMYDYIYSRTTLSVREKFRLDYIIYVREYLDDYSSFNERNYAVVAQQLMRNPQPNYEKYIKAKLQAGVQEGDQDCLVYDPGVDVLFDATVQDPYIVELGSMFNPPQNNWETNNVRWDRLPKWFLDFAGNVPWQLVREEWQRGVLPLAEQIRFVALQEYIIQKLDALEWVEKDESYWLPGKQLKILGLFTALKWYRGAGFQVMNHVLRNDPEYDEPIRLENDTVNALQLMQWIMEILPPCPVYSITYRYSTLTDNIKEMQVGDQIVFKGYTSVSMNLLKAIDVVDRLGNSNNNDTSSNNVNMVLMEIHLPAGSRFLVIPSSENEIVLPHYSQFTVLQKRQLASHITYLTLRLTEDPTNGNKLDFVE